MARRTLDTKIIQIVVLTAITVVVWIGVDIYRALTRTVEPKVPEEQTRRLDPQIDLEFMEKLKSRTSPTEEELGSVPTIMRFNLRKEEKTGTGSAERY